MRWKRVTTQLFHQKFEAKNLKPKPGEDPEGKTRQHYPIDIVWWGIQDDPQDYIYHQYYYENFHGEAHH